MVILRVYYELLISVEFDLIALLQKKVEIL